MRNLIQNILGKLFCIVESKRIWGQFDNFCLSMSRRGLLFSSAQRYPHPSCQTSQASRLYALLQALPLAPCILPVSRIFPKFQPLSRALCLYAFYFLETEIGLATGLVEEQLVSTIGKFDKNDGDIVA